MNAGEKLIMSRRLLRAVKIFTSIDAANTKQNNAADKYRRTRLNSVVEACLHAPAVGHCGTCSSTSNRLIF